MASFLIDDDRVRERFKCHIHMHFSDVKDLMYIMKKTVAMSKSSKPQYPDFTESQMKLAEELCKAMKGMT